MEEKRQIKNANIVWGAFGNGNNCTGIVENITKPDEGGIFTKYIGCNYLFKGYPDEKVVFPMEAPKNVIMRTALLLTDKAVLFILLFASIGFILIPKKKKLLIKIADEFFLDIVWEPMKSVILEDNRYCSCVKETIRAIDLAFGDYSDYNKNPVSRIKKRIRDFIAMSLEYDYAYRARYQDIIPLFDKNKFKRNPRKELFRLLDILSEREEYSKGGKNIIMQRKWKSLKFVAFIGFLIKDVKKIVVKFFNELNLDEIKFDEADWYYVCDRDDYLYGGLSHKQRMENRYHLDKKVGNKKVVIKFEKDA